MQHIQVSQFLHTTAQSCFCCYEGNENEYKSIQILRLSCELKFRNNLVEKQEIRLSKQGISDQI